MKTPPDDVPFGSFLEALVASPIGWPVRAYARLFEGLDRIPTADEVDERLGKPAGVRFVLATRKRPGERKVPYNERIVSQGEVETRAENLHDFANALVWAAFPKSKWALHVRQHAMIEERSRLIGSKHPQRTEEEDAVAMLDEGGVCVVTTPAEEDSTRHALITRDTPALEALAGRGQALGVIFGHAILEHLGSNQTRAIWGQAPLFVFPKGTFARDALDVRFAKCLADRTFARHPRELGSVLSTPSVLGAEP